MDNYVHELWGESVHVKTVRVLLHMYEKGNVSFLRSPRERTFSHIGCSLDRDRCQCDVYYYYFSW